MSKWPEYPLDAIVERISKLPKQQEVADMGCGDAKLRERVKQKVHSFDLVATNEHVVACDIAHVPLKKKSVDVVVFSLSLMGTNVADFIKEAWRILKPNGKLLIAEVKSRFETTSISTFEKSVCKLGFTHDETVCTHCHTHSHL